MSPEVTTLYAKWSGKQISVSFNSNGGSTVENRTYYVDKQYNSLPTPTKDGYSFDGWYTSSSFTMKVTNSSKVSYSVKTLYAKWVPAAGTIYVVPETGTIPASGGTGTIEIQCTDTWTVNVDDANFWRWYTMVSTPYSGNFTATYSVDANTSPIERQSVISFLCGNTIKTHTIIQAAASIHKTEVNDALDNDFFSFVAGGDAAWYGQTEKSHDNEDAVCCNLYSGDQTSWIETDIVGPGTLSFWWYASGRSYSDSFNFKIDGENQLAPTHYDHFSNWEKRSFEISAGSHKVKWECQTGNSRSSLYAYIDEVRWTPSYTITYAPGLYGSGSERTSTKTEDFFPALLNAIYTRPGYCQTGWSLSIDGATKDYNFAVIMASLNYNLTIYPFWTPNSYEINYVLDGGTASDTYPNVAEYDSPLKLSAPEKYGFAFAGWKLSGATYTTAKYGINADSQNDSITSADQVCQNGNLGDLWFKNLTIANNGEVTLTATWSCLHSETVIKDANPPTCTECGFSGKVICKNCGVLISSGAETLPLGHEEDNGTVTKQPTSTEEGLLTYRCTRCQEVIRDDILPRVFTGPTWEIDSMGTLTKVDLHGFRDIAIPDGVVTIPNNFFANSDITSIEFPESLRSIGHYAFTNCANLTSVTIPDNVWYLGWYAFRGCTELKEVHLGNKVTEICTAAFHGCSSLQHVEMSENVTSIGYAAFYECSSLTNVVIPQSVVSIDKYAFYGCSNVNKIVMNNVVETIDYAAFFGCERISEIMFPASLSKLGEYAFAKCSTLKEIDFEGDAPETAENTFVLVSSACTAIVKRTSSGWGEAIPGLWKGININYWACPHVGTRTTVGYKEASWNTTGFTGDIVCDVCGEIISQGSTVAQWPSKSIPQISEYSSPSTVSNSLTSVGFVDRDGVFAVIGGSARRYAKFKAWASEIPGGETAVAYSSHAAAAYALGCKQLFSDVPRVNISEINAMESSSIPATRSFLMDISVKDNETPIAVDSARVAAMIQATDDLGDWEKSSLSPEISDITKNFQDHVRVSITVKDTCASKAFFRVNVNPKVIADIDPDPIFVATPPSNVTASDGTSASFVNVSWDAVANATSYQIWRSSIEDSDTATQIGSSTSLSYSDTSAIAGTHYFYWVKTLVHDVESELSSMYDTGWKSLSAPSVTASSASNGIQISWTSVPGTETYRVYKSTSSNVLGTLLASISSTSYLDSNVTTNIYYYYSVQAVGKHEQSGYGKVKGATGTYPHNATLQISSLKTVLTALDSNKDKIISNAEFGAGMSNAVLADLDGSSMTISDSEQLVIGLIYSFITNSTSIARAINGYTTGFSDEMAFRMETISTMAEEIKSKTFSLQTLNLGSSLSTTNTADRTGVIISYSNGMNLIPSNQALLVFRTDLTYPIGVMRYSAPTSTGSSLDDLLARLTKVYKFTDTTAVSGKTYAYYVRLYSLSGAISSKSNMVSGKR